MVKAWLKQPGAVKRVHVLLDRKGKTQSHAFVEMRDEDAARAALRTAQNSVLGRGKVSPFFHSSYMRAERSLFF